MYLNSGFSATCVTIVPLFLCYGGEKERSISSSIITFLHWAAELGGFVTQIVF